MRLVGRILLGLLATLGTLTLLAVAAAAFLVWQLSAERYELPERILLTADWRSSLGETAGPPDLLDLQFRPPPTVTDTVLALDAAARDPRVRGLVVRLAETEHGFAVAQELRAAVLRFRAAGKFAIAEADSFGELGSGNEGYHIATAFESIMLQPGGLVGLTGTAVQVPFARDLLARVELPHETLASPVAAAYVSMAESLAADLPLVAIFDDVHLASADEKATFVALATAVRGHAMLVLGTSRGPAPLALPQGCGRIAMRRLAADATQRVVRDVVYVAEPIPRGEFFELVSMVDDETEALANAQAAIARAAGFERVHSTEYELAFVLDDFDLVRERVVAADPARAERIAAVEGKMRARFRAGEYRAPMRADLLRVVSSGL